MVYIESLLSCRPFSKKDLQLFPNTVLPKALQIVPALTLAGTLMLAGALTFARA